MSELFSFTFKMNKEYKEKVLKFQEFLEKLVIPVFN